jgi:hypothetical protein
VPDGVPYGLTSMQRIRWAVIMSTNTATIRQDSLSARQSISELENSVQHVAYPPEDRRILHHSNMVS